MNAHVNQATREGDTPLLHVTRCERLEEELRAWIVEKLLDLNAELNKANEIGDTPLLQASRKAPACSCTKKDKEKKLHVLKK